jgi:Zn-dependent protease
VRAGPRAAPLTADLRLDAHDHALIRGLRPEAAAIWAATGGSALFSALLYSALWGAPIACGLVLGMWVHELGHRAVLRRLGLVSSPIVFVPFIGAVQRVPVHPARAFDAALVGLAGPLCGLAFAAGCKLGYAVSGEPALRFLATAHALLALVDLLPFGMLDGKRVVAALARRERIVCACAAGALAVLGSSLALVPMTAALAWTSTRPAAIRREPWIGMLLVTLLAAAVFLT